MSEEHRYSEVAESDDELPLTQGAAVQVTQRPAAAVLTSQAEPRFVKVHKSRTSAKRNKQSTRRDLLTVLGKKPTPTAKVGGRSSAKKDGTELRRSSPELLGRRQGPSSSSEWLSRLETKLRLTLKKTYNCRPKKQVKHVKEPVIYFLRPEFFNLSQGVN
jgi:hypothetical protein